MAGERSFEELIRTVKDGSTFESLRAAQKLAEWTRERRRSSERVMRQVVLDGAGEDSPAHESSTDPLDDPVEFIASDASAAIREALDQLPAKDASILRAIFIEEKPKDAVCAEFGIDRSYLRVLLHQARKASRRAYLKKLDEELSRTS